ncbi:MAG: hypothetical protein ACTHJK_13495 [Sphingomicrobium sp.]
MAVAVVLLAIPTMSAKAISPPPPPAWVTVEADLIALDKGVDPTAGEQLSHFVANDVRVYINDKLVADGKADWLRHFGPAPIGHGRVVASSGNWHANDSLMVVEQFDSVDRSKVPPDVADSGSLSRVTLYRFGPDHKIHAIRTLIGGGAWAKP